MENQPIGQRWKGIMKCYPFEEKRLLKWSPPFLLQPKYDGDRCRVETYDGKAFLISSEENIFVSAPHINQQLEESGLYSLPLDGELYSHDLFLEGGHELIHSIASRTVNLHPRHEELELWVFDIKSPGETQASRTKFLSSLHYTKNIKLSPAWICYSLSEIKTHYDRIVHDGFEGIVVRNFSGFYEEKRSTNLMKFKPKRKDVYKVIGWNEEVSIHGQPKGRIGSLVLSSQSGDTFSVSAGLNDDDRSVLWDKKDLLFGKDAVVQYQHLTNKHIPKGCMDIEVLGI